MSISVFSRPLPFLVIEKEGGRVNMGHRASLTFSNNHGISHGGVLFHLFALSLSGISFGIGGLRNVTRVYGWSWE